MKNNFISEKDDHRILSSFQKKDDHRILTSEDAFEQIWDSRKKTIIQTQISKINTDTSYTEFTDNSRLWRHTHVNSLTIENQINIVKSIFVYNIDKSIN